MKIGIDVDGVLLDFEKGMLVQAELYDMDIASGKGKIHSKPYFVQNKYDWTDKEKEDFIKKNLGKVSEESCLMAGVKEILPRLQNQGHELIIISARGTGNEEMIDIVTKKFDEAGVKFNKCFWKIKNKVEICKQENIDIMIDDSPTICENMIENEIKTIYFRGIRGYNLPENPKLIELNNWGEVYRFISKTNLYGVNPQILEYVGKNIFPKYENDNGAHGISHIKQVIDRSFELMLKNDLKLNRDMVYVIAAYHDIGHQRDAKTHEKISAQIFIEDENMKKWFTEEERKTIKEAIEDHRASSDHEPRSTYGKLVSTADRTIMSIEEYIKRTYLYGLKNYPELSRDERVARVYKHLIKKYGENGYAKMYFQDDKLIEALQEIRKELKDQVKFENKTRKIIENM